jgi:hypothetical protein
MYHPGAATGHLVRLLAPARSITLSLRKHLVARKVVRVGDGLTDCPASSPSRSSAAPPGTRRWEAPQLPDGASSARSSQSANDLLTKMGGLYETLDRRRSFLSNSTRGRLAIVAQLARLGAGLVTQCLDCDFSFRHRFLDELLADLQL